MHFGALAKVPPLPQWASGVSLSEPRSVIGRDRGGGVASRAWAAGTENGSSPAPTLSVCSDGTLTYTF